MVDGGVLYCIFGMSIPAFIFNLSSAKRLAFFSPLSNHFEVANAPCSFHPQLPILFHKLLISLFSDPLTLRFNEMLHVLFHLHVPDLPMLLAIYITPPPPSLLHPDS